MVNIRIFLTGKTDSPKAKKPQEPTNRVNSLLKKVAQKVAE